MDLWDFEIRHYCLQNMWQSIGNKMHVKKKIQLVSLDSRPTVPASLRGKAALRARLVGLSECVAHFQSPQNFYSI